MDLNTYLFRESFIDACNSCFVCVNCWFLFLSMFCCCCCLTFVEINIYPFRMKWFDVCISVLHKPPTKYLIYWCKRSVDVRSYSSCSCCSLGVIYIYVFISVLLIQRGIVFLLLPSCIHKPHTQISYYDIKM